MKEKLLIMVLAVVFAACSHRQDGDTTTATSAQYEALRRDVAAMLSDEPDSVFAMLDRLEISDQYPYCVVNLIRGNMYGQSHHRHHSCVDRADWHHEHQYCPGLLQPLSRGHHALDRTCREGTRLTGKIMAIKQQLSKIICTFAQ